MLWRTVDPPRTIARQYKLRVTQVEKMLDSIFKPASIAVIGASEKPGSVGGAIVSNLRKADFPGRLFAVNSNRGTLGGEQVFGSIAELAETPDLAVVCTPAATVPAIVRECGQRGVEGMIVISAGFREAGASGRDLEFALRSAASEFPRLRFLGPNCLGAIRTSNHLNASFSPVMPSAGRLTLLSQSGALCTAILDWSVEREIGFANCVSVGNMTNVGMGDLIDYFSVDSQTDAILLYIEGLDDPRHFLRAARDCSRRKPIIGYKAGRFAESSAAAASHTGAIASSDAVYQAAFRRAGIERAYSIEELFDCAQLLIRPCHPKGNRLAIITNAGGPGVMASDAWLATGGRLAKLSGDTLACLDQQLPRCWSHGNPVDVLGDAPVERFQAAIKRTLDDPNVDAVLVIVTPQTMTDPDGIAQSVVRAQSATDKPIVASWIGGAAVQSGRKVLKDAGVPAYDFPEDAVNALHHLFSTGRMKTVIDESPAALSGNASGHEELRRVTPQRLQYWRDKLTATTGLLDEARSKELLVDYGIPVAASRIALNADQAVQFADEIGYPVVLKVISPEISHKTDVGGVVLNVASADAVRERYAGMLNDVHQRAPGAPIEGIAVQRMISEARGVELLVGMTRDRQFGPVMLVGAGGITTELQKDSALELLPLTDRLIDRMLNSLRIYPLLEGYRGRAGVNIPLLRQVVARFIQLVEDFPNLSAVEINPLLISAENAVALDVRVICDRHK